MTKYNLTWPCQIKKLKSTKFTCYYMPISNKKIQSLQIFWASHGQVKLFLVMLNYIIIGLNLMIIAGWA